MIEISNLWPLFLKQQDFSELKNFELSFRDQNKRFSHDEIADFFVSWGDSAPKIKHCVAETGFFQNAMHFDSIGLYESASFNFSSAKKIISEYCAPKTWREFNKDAKLVSKFPQPVSTGNWDGIVVACQYPEDRSVLRVGSIKDYYQFLDNACKYYGKKAFLKTHPVTVGNEKIHSVIESIAAKHKSEMGHVGSTILDRAEAVIVYNSTYVVDALLKGKRVFQYAPGYFWQSGVVQYLSGEMSSAFLLEDADYVDKFLDFLLWKYCFNMTMPLESIVKIIKEFSISKKIFPLPEELSYGAFLNE